MYKIQFNRPSIMGKELYYISQAIHNGHSAADGEFTRKCQVLLQESIGANKVFLTTSCTHALEISAFLLNIEPGDEIILPSYTFVSTANAFVIRGAKPVFVDIRNDTLNLDESQLEDSITSRTKAIIPVHYAGVSCEMETICQIAAEYNLPIVEDNAHGLFAKYKGRYLGTFGQLAAQSFHETKNFTCGEGGALIINDERYIKNAEIIKNKGTNRSSFFRGEVDKYTWVGLGSSYLLSDLLAAFLFAQLEEKEKIINQRKSFWNAYNRRLKDWAIQNNVRMPFVPSHCEQSYHMFYLILPDLKSRNKIISCLKKKSILSVFHYIPLHSSPMGKKFGYLHGDLPVTEFISERLLRLPLYNNMNHEDQKMIIECIMEINLQ